MRRWCGWMWRFTPWWAVPATALMLAREPVGLLYTPTLAQMYQRLSQAAGRNLVAHRQIVAALAQRDAAAAAEWTHKHLIDFQRGFALAGLDMRTPIALPTQRP